MKEKFLHKFLDEFEIGEIRSLLKDKKWLELRQEALEAWKNGCSEAIYLGKTEEQMKSHAYELQHGTRAIKWFFEVFVPAGIGGEEKKVDKEKEKK